MLITCWHLKIKKLKRVDQIGCEQNELIHQNC